MCLSLEGDRQTDKDRGGVKKDKREIDFKLSAQKL